MAVGIETSHLSLFKLENSSIRHIDAAFGALAVLHNDFKHLSKDLALADSITSDAHVSLPLRTRRSVRLNIVQKWLQTPYDCGLFFGKGEVVREICGPGLGRQPPAYLSPPQSAPHEGESPQLLLAKAAFAAVPPPLHVNIENSRRFRALPLYANLMSLGREGYSEIVNRNITFARSVVQWLQTQPDWEVLLTAEPEPENCSQHTFRVMNIVLFTISRSCQDARLRQDDGAAEATKRINATRQVYVSPTVWRGRGAIRMAISNVCTSFRELPNLSRCPLTEI